MRKLASLSLARARMRSSSGSPRTVSFARTRTLAPARDDHVRDDVLDRPLAGDLPNLVHQVLAQPTRLRLGMRGDDDLVDLLGGEHILHRGERLVVEHAAMGGDPSCPQSAERALEPSAGSSTPRVAVHDVALARLCHRGDNRDADGSPLSPSAHSFHELGADERLVRDHENGGRVGHRPVSGL